MPATTTALQGRHTGRVRTALLREYAVAAAACEAGATPAVAAALVRGRFLAPALAELFVAAGLPEARAVYADLTRRYGKAQKAAPEPGLLSSWTQRLRAYITTEGARSLRAITETTRATVRRVLSRAAEQGLSVPDAARALREQAAELAGPQAVKIIRTELTAAANYGSLMGAQATGIKLEKGWLAANGMRTRPSHQQASGQYVPLDGTFTVGGWPARYPGDELLPAKERVNCRCSILYRPKG